AAEATAPQVVGGRAPNQRLGTPPSCRGAQGTGHGSACQISAAYSAMVRSLENLPEQATLRIAFRAQASGSAYNSPTRCWAWAMPSDAVEVGVAAIAFVVILVSFLPVCGAREQLCARGRSWVPRGHGDDKLHSIFAGFSGRHQRAERLHFSPAEGASRPMRDQAHLVPGLFHPDLDEALEVGGPAVHEGPGHRLRREGPGMKVLHPQPQRLFPGRGLRVRLADREILPREEGAAGTRRVFGPIQRRTDARVGAAAAVDEMVHGARRPAGLVRLLVALEVMRIPGH